MRDWSVRTIYLYLVSFVTLMMIIWGTVQFINVMVAFAYPPPIYSPTPADLKIQAANQNVPIEVVQEQARIEEQRQLQQARYDRARRTAQSLALLLVAVPVYLYHWRKIQHDAQKPPASNEHPA